MTDQADVLKRLEEIEANLGGLPEQSDVDQVMWLIRLIRRQLEVEAELQVLLVQLEEFRAHPLTFGYGTPIGTGYGLGVGYAAAKLGDVLMKERSK